MNRPISPAPVQTAFDWVDRRPAATSPIALPLAQALGYRLAQDLAAPTDLPERAKCGRDGYALRSTDTLGAGDYNPLPLRLLSDPQAVSVGCARKVSAGDDLPVGADTVLGLELADERGRFLDVVASLAAGEGIVQAGEECRRGERLLPAGRRLRPQDLARLAQAGQEGVAVLARPRVRLCLAGRFERDADGPLLSALIERDGGDLTATQRTATQAELVAGISMGDADLILVAGGTGYGIDDWAVAALQACGRVDVDGVTLHPGGGLVLGEAADCPVVLLPGSPLACLCAYDLVAARLLRRLAGRSTLLPYRRRTLTLSRKLVSRIGQMEVARLRIDGDSAEPLAVADDRLLASSVRADGFALLAENSEGFAEGSRVEVWLYDEWD